MALHNFQIIIESSLSVSYFFGQMIWIYLYVSCRFLDDYSEIM